MMNDVLSFIIQTLQTLPPEIVGIFMYLCAVATVFILNRSFGKDGLFLFIVLMVVIANIQALKAINLFGLSAPVPMGSILFTMSFLATDIIAELYGRQEAEKAIWLSFSATLMISLFMILTLGTKAAEGLERYQQAHQAIEFIFTPTTALFIASIAAYLISQYSDMFIFLGLKKLTQGKNLGFRTVIATLTSTLLDTILFSVLAWKVFYPLPIAFSTFCMTYILGTYGVRVLVSFANTPIIYLLRRQSQGMPHVAYVS